MRRKREIVDGKIRCRVCPQWLPAARMRGHSYCSRACEFKQKQTATIEKPALYKIMRLMLACELCATRGFTLDAKNQPVICQCRLDIKRILG